MRPVRLGIVGIGGMGSSHAKECAESALVELVAFADVDEKRRSELASRHGARAFGDAAELLGSGIAEAILIATPHYSHPTIALAAFEAGVHVLCEKPIAVHVKDARRMTAAYERARAAFPGLRFGAMFQQRSLGLWRVVKSLVESGSLGRLVRATWIITTWFRTQHYYDSGSWRATWKGEGGGVLLNQCPHNLDLYQWILGMPSRISAVASFGKYHRIEVEDEVSAIFEHENGMVGHFITSTAEAPGTDRLEIAGENGRLVVERGTATVDRNERSMLEVIRTSVKSFDSVPHVTEQLALQPDPGKPHLHVVEQFARAIREGAPLVAAGQEGERSVEIANAIMMSKMEGTGVALPIDGDAYEAILGGLIADAEAARRAGGAAGEAARGTT